MFGFDTYLVWLCNTIDPLLFLTLNIVVPPLDIVIVDVNPNYKCLAFDKIVTRKPWLDLNFSHMLLVLKEVKISTNKGYFFKICR